MNDDITIVRVPTGLNVPPAMQEAQDRLLGRFGNPPQVAKNLQSVVNNPNTALLFAIAGSAPQTSDEWQALPSSAYAGTVTVLLQETTTHRVAHIDDVIVDADYEGRGVGKKLMQKAIEVSHENDTFRLELTSRPDKVAAQFLYEKVGFKKRETNNWRYGD